MAYTWFLMLEKYSAWDCHIIMPINFVQSSRLSSFYCFYFINEASFLVLSHSYHIQLMTVYLKVFLVAGNSTECQGELLYTIYLSVQESSAWADQYSNHAKNQLLVDNIVRWVGFGRLCWHNFGIMGAPEHQELCWHNNRYTFLIRWPEHCELTISFD